VRLLAATPEANRKRGPDPGTPLSATAYSAGTGIGGSRSLTYLPAREKLHCKRRPMRRIRVALGEQLVARP
jgi:hypothetical protein